MSGSRRKARSDSADSGDHGRPSPCSSAGFLPLPFLACWLHPPFQVHIPFLPDPTSRTHHLGGDRAVSRNADPSAGLGAPPLFLIPDFAKAEGSNSAFLLWVLTPVTCSSSGYLGLSLRLGHTLRSAEEEAGGPPPLPQDRTLHPSSIISTTTSRKMQRDGQKC